MDAIKKLLMPFKNMNECCIAIFIKKKWHHLGFFQYCKIIRKYFNFTCDDNEIKIFFGRVSSLSFLFPSTYINEFQKIEESLNKINDKIINFESSENQCYFCRQYFEEDSRRTQYNAHLYNFSKSSEECTISTIECGKCNTVHFPSYAILKNKDRFYYENVLDLEFVAFSNETVIEALLLQSVTKDLVYKHSSFIGFCGAYNSLFKNDISDETRCMLIDKRLTEYWFYYNLIIFEKETRDTLRGFKGFFLQDLDEALQSIHSKLFQHFIEKWSNHQDSCHHPQCSIAINIDGNHKVNRLTCMFDHSFDKPELKSTIAVSCPNTPERNRYYCKEHSSENMCRPFYIESKIVHINVSEITAARKEFIQAHSPYTIHDCFVNQENDLLFLAIGEKKETFWIIESDVPKSSMEEFFNLYENRKDKTLLSDTKCMIRKEDAIPCMKKTRTTGVMLAVYNCGIVCGFAEIFSHESATQVTSFLLDLIEHLKDFKKWFIYDNACHLKKYMKKSMSLTTDRAIKLSQVQFVIDRLHIKNHVDAECKKTYNANLYSELKAINTVVCEETNFWFSRYKYIAKHMNSERYFFFIYIILNTYNEEKLKLLKKNHSK